jgi:uncharacterized membrane protein
VQKLSLEIKTAYLAELRRLLAKLPEEERQAALTYYEEYFDDAGAEETERVLSELGPAQALAEQILAGFNRNYLDAVPTNSSASLPARPEEVAEARRAEEEARKKAEEERLAAAHAAAGEQAKVRVGPKGPPPSRSGASILLIVVLVILALPLLLPLFFTVFGLIIGLMALILGLGLGFFGVVLALLVGGVVLLAAGFSLMFVHILHAFIACGAGLMLLGAGAVMLVISLYLLVKVIPALLRFLGRLLMWPFKGRGVWA